MAVMAANSTAHTKGLDRDLVRQSARNMGPEFAMPTGVPALEQLAMSICLPHARPLSTCHWGAHQKENTMSKVADSIRRGLQEALAYADGTADPRAYQVHVPATINVKAIRANLP